MAAELAYTTAKRKEKPVKFSVDGRDMEFNPPKRASMVLPVIEQEEVEAMGVMAMKSQFDWLAAGLSEEDAEYLQDRLKDPKDDFDVPDIDKLFDWIMKQVNGRPTG